jgi:hypothetical protein
MPLSPNIYIFFFSLVILGLELMTFCLQSSTLLLEPYHQPLLVWICQGDCLCPCRYRHIYPHISRCH